jgi:Helix-turn-helix domain
MKRAAWLQETRNMKFIQTYESWSSGRLTQTEAAQILGICERTFRRQLVKYDEGGFEALADKRLTQPSRRKAPIDEVKALASLYKRSFSNYNVRHFHEHYEATTSAPRSYSWTKRVLQTEGLVKVAKARGKHRIKRERKPLPGMMIHQDASTHEWLAGHVWDLVVTMDDATSEHLDMRFVAQEGTASSLAGIKAVLLSKGIPSSFYSDRGAHYWSTPKAGGKVDKVNLTQFGCAMKRLGIDQIAAYSPQARGRSERAFKTHQGRLPQELASAGITAMAQANEYLRTTYMPQFNQRFAVPASEGGSAYVAIVGADIAAQMDELLSQRHERVVGNDNCVRFDKLKLQIPSDTHRMNYVRTKVQLRVNCEGCFSIYHGPRCLARYDVQGVLLVQPQTLAQTPMKGERQ